MTTEYKIHPDAPRDDEGYPIHPEKGYHICARAKSEKADKTSHGRERDDVPYCLQAAGWGTKNPKRAGEPGVGCKNHGGNAPKGPANGQYEHGEYSKFRDYIRGRMGEEKRAVFDALDLSEDGELFVEDVVKEAYLKYLKTQDVKFLRAARQWASEFGVLETVPEKHEFSGEVEQSGEFQINITHHHVDSTDD